MVYKYTYMSNYQNNRDIDFYPFSVSDPNIKYEHFPAVVIKGRSRKKMDITWEQADKRSNGLYSRYLQQIAKNFPGLTTMELKICTLIKSLKPSREIAELLFVSEHTVENHRVNIRKKIGVSNGSNLVAILLSL